MNSLDFVLFFDCLVSGALYKSKIKSRTESQHSENTVMQTETVWQKYDW